LAGVTFLALANGAPDVLTAVLAGASTSASTELIPFGSIFGGALFSTAYILSAVIFQSPSKRLKVKLDEIIVPLSFYIFGMGFLIIISAAYGKMNAYLASVLLVAYVM
jgi:sodium/potassium/calcium exchanger 6